MDVKRGYEAFIVKELVQDINSINQAYIQGTGGISNLKIYGTHDVVEAYAYHSDNPIQHAQELFLDESKDVSLDDFEELLERLFTANEDLVETA